MFGKFELFIYVLIILLISVAFFLSLIDVKQIIELKNGNVVKTTTTETTETTETKKDATN